MIREDAKEAAAIAQRMLTALMATVPAEGRAGSDARAAIGDARTNAFPLLMADAFGPPLDKAFDLARQAGSSMQALDAVRAGISRETPKTLGAVLVQNAGIRLCLATEGAIIATMSFESRETVEDLKAQLLQPFHDAEEIAADEMDQMTFQALISLHGALTNHLSRTARPLPQILQFQFYEPLPSLVLAYRLYADASRADEIRAENQVIHPAFCPPIGRALSA